METVGEILDEIEKIRITIRDLASINFASSENKPVYENAIVLLDNYQRTLRELQIKK